MAGLARYLLWKFLPIATVFAAVLLYLAPIDHGHLRLQPTHLYHELKWAGYYAADRLQPYTSRVGLGVRRKQLVAAYIAKEAPIAKAGILANIGPHGSKSGGAKPGIVIASPSTKDPDYLYTWTRDAALVLKLLVDEYTYGYDLSLGDLINDYVTAQAELQKVANPSGGPKTGGLGEPKFYINHTAFTDPWGRPQHDGPALRAMTLISYSKWLLENSNETHVSEVLWPIIEKDLDYVVNYWNRTGFDLWEEVSSSSFFTTAVQHRALREGATLAEAISGKAAAAQYAEQADNALCFLQTYWNEDISYVVANTAPGRSGKDANVILASIHTFDPAAGCDSTTFQPCSDKVLATVYAYTDVFRGLYKINWGQPYGDAIATGRYPEDIYMGGHPWYLTTAAVAELLYDAIYVWKRQGYVGITKTSLSFFRIVLPTIRPRMYTWEDPLFVDIVLAVKHLADGFLAVNAKYTPWDGSLSEQFHRNTGELLSAMDLTWSYAASLTAFHARAEVLRPQPWGAKNLQVPHVCKSNPPKLIPLEFSVIAETVYGEDIYVTGSIEALQHWSTDLAVKLSATKYPTWTGRIEVPANSALEYKYIRKGDSDSVTWEAGGNRFLETSDEKTQTHDEWHD
ncbi:hypothetical protein ONZ45_g4517 [Pleurotus djamor]|nr:hypothetical protein ONZ45_g4517 [Pleurotus djamor]